MNCCACTMWACAKCVSICVLLCSVCKEFSFVYISIRSTSIGFLDFNRKNKGCVLHHLHLTRVSVGVSWQSVYHYYGYANTSIRIMSTDDIWGACQSSSIQELFIQGLMVLFRTECDQSPSCDSIPLQSSLVHFFLMQVWFQMWQYPTPPFFGLILLM